MRWLTAIVIAALLTSTGVVYAGQRAALGDRRAERDAARGFLDATLGKARSGGVAAAQLDPIAQQERRILAERALPATLFIFQSKESAHLRNETASLEALTRRAEGVLAAVTDTERASAANQLNDYEAAISAARDAGLDVSPDEEAEAAARRSLTAATTPAAVHSALSPVLTRVAKLRDATAQKIAADEAAAAAEKALEDSKDAAQFAITRGQKLLSQAQAFPQLQVSDFAAQLAQAQAAFAAATSQSDFDAVRKLASGGVNGLSQLLKARSDAYADMGSARQTLQDAATYHVDVGTVPAQLDSIQQQLDAAGTAPAFQGLQQQIDALITPVNNRLGIAELGVGKVILISLSSQRLTAYQDGQKLLSTLVTTGRPALPTPPGATTVIKKDHPWMMVSDWPKSSPYWYPPSEVQYVLWFREGGYGIHDAPWRSYYGPGTEAHGSHGCVNVPLDPMITLFNWADVGTRVVVQE